MGDEWLCVCVFVWLFVWVCVSVCKCVYVCVSVYFFAPTCMHVRSPAFDAHTCILFRRVRT